MGIYDRDYMREEPNSRGRKGTASHGAGVRVTDQNSMVKWLTLIVGSVLFLLLLRYPIPPLIKIPVLFGLGYVIYRAVVILPRRAASASTRDRPSGLHYLKKGQEFEEKRDYKAAANQYSLAADALPSSKLPKIRLLACLDCSQQTQKAAEAVRQLDGLVFDEQEQLEVEVFASKHFELKFEPADGGQKLTLGAKLVN